MTRAANHCVRRVINQMDAAVIINALEERLPRGSK
jgi:hypothetical protein